MILRLLRGNLDMGAAPGSRNVITLSGGGTIGIEDNHILHCAYRPATPNLSIQRRRIVGRDGGIIGSVNEQNIVETCQIFIEETNKIAVPSGTYDVYSLLKEFVNQAKDYSRTGLGDPIYFEISYDGDIAFDETVNFERGKVFFGRIELSDTDFELRFLQQDRGLITVEWEREHFLEWYASANATISNDFGGPATSVAIQNTSDATGDNWVDVLLTTQTELPTPYNITIGNTSGTTVSRVFLSINTKSDAANFKHILEGTNAAVGSTYQLALSGLQPGDTLVSEATASNNDYLRFAFTGATPLQTILMAEWVMATASLDAAAGNYFRAFLVLRGDSTGGDDYLADDDFEARLSFSETATGAVLYNTRWVGLDKRYSVQELMTVQLPPALAGITFIEDIKIQLQVRHSSTSAQQIEWDFLAFLPANQYRKLMPVTQLTGTLDTGSIIDNPRLPELYSTGAGFDKVPNYHGVGNPLVLEADDSNESQRLYILFDTLASVNKNEADNTGTLALSFFPRTEVPST